MMPYPWSDDTRRLISLILERPLSGRLPFAVEWSEGSLVLGDESEVEFGFWLSDTVEALLVEVNCRVVYVHELDGTPRELPAEVDRDALVVVPGLDIEPPLLPLRATCGDCGAELAACSC